MLAHGNSLDCGLFMSGSAARAASATRGGTRPAAASAGRGCQTPAADGAARSFEEAEAARHQRHGVGRSAI